MGSISQIREVLKAASRYAAEVGDVDKLIITSLECLRACLDLWRLYNDGILSYGMHESCLESEEEGGCLFQCFADLQYHIQQYTSELSKVFFRKKRLQSDRRWWLSVFYSLFLQAPVRQTLVKIQAQTSAGHLNNDPDPTPCSQYCYTALNIFDAASAGWDPIASDDDLGLLLSGPDIDQKVAKHITVARETVLQYHAEDETHDSFELLKNLFEMHISVRVWRRITTTRIPSKESTAMTSPLALSIANAEQAPHFSDSEYASTDHAENDDSATGRPPPLPLSRFILRDGPFSSGFKRGVNKRRATSPPIEVNNERRLSTDSFSQFLSTTDDTSDRANSISSMNSFSSINTAYGTLALDSPGSGHSSRLMSSSPHSATPDNMQKLDMPRAMGCHEVIGRRASKLRTNAVGEVQGFYICDCCPEKPKEFDTLEELNVHVAEKKYECAYCGIPFKSKNEADQHTNSLHIRRYSWSCSLLSTYDRLFYDSRSQKGQADMCGYCGVDFDRTATTKYARYPSDDDWDKRVTHLQDHHKFRGCNTSKKFYRVDHFRQHLKHSHAAVWGDWMDKLEESCMQEEIPEDLAQSSGEASEPV